MKYIVGNYSIYLMKDLFYKQERMLREMSTLLVYKKGKLAV